MSEERFFIIETESVHRIKYLIRGPENLKISDAFEIVRKDGPIELQQEWVGEKGISLSILTDEQIKEILPKDEDIV